MFYDRIGERSRLARRMRFTFTPGASAEDFSPDIRPRSHDRLLSTLDIRLLSPGACRVFHSFDFAIFDCEITIKVEQRFICAHRWKAKSSPVCAGGLFAFTLGVKTGGV